MDVINFALSFYSVKHNIRSYIELSFYKHIVDHPVKMKIRVERPGFKLLNYFVFEHIVSKTKHLSSVGPKAEDFRPTATATVAEV